MLFNASIPLLFLILATFRSIVVTFNFNILVLLETAPCCANCGLLGLYSTNLQPLGLDGPCIRAPV